LILSSVPPALDDLAVDVSLNLQTGRAAYMHTTRTADGDAPGLVRGRLFQGEFGGKGFHDITGPTVDGRVLRWHADLGSADVERAVHELAGRLAKLKDPTVRRLIIGTQSAG
jgi:hypothetical protein